MVRGIDVSDYYTDGPPWFCGVLQCLSPEPNQIIVPDWMMRSMFLDECTTVNVRTAELDKIAGLTLQPCNSDFNEKDVLASTERAQKCS